MGEGLVCQHCHVWWHHHVPRYCRQDAEGDHCLGSLHHQDQDHCSTREEVLCLDRWLHLVLPLHLPTDVDHQAGVRRVRPIHCPQEVLLRSYFILSTLLNVTNLFCQLIYITNVCYSCCCT